MKRRLGASFKLHRYALHRLSQSIHYSHMRFNHPWALTNDNQITDIHDFASLFHIYLLYNHKCLLASDMKQYGNQALSVFIPNNLIEMCGDQCINDANTHILYSILQ